MNLTLKIFLVLATFLWLIGYCRQTSNWEISAGLPIDQSKSDIFYEPENINYPEIFWLGHSGMLVKWDKQVIVLDPIVRDYVSLIPRLFPLSYRSEDIPRVDYLLLSHMHYDHYDPDSIKKIKEVKTIILPKNSETFLHQDIIERATIVPLEEEELFMENGFRFTALYTKHNGSRFHPFTSKYRASAYLIEKNGISLYFPGDTGYGPHLMEVGEKYAPTISILPIGAYEPYFILKNYHLNPEDALRTGRDLKSKYIIPCHFGTFRIALDKPDIALPLFLKEAKKSSVNVKLARPFTGTALE